MKDDNRLTLVIGWRPGQKSSTTLVGSGDRSSRGGAPWRHPARHSETVIFSKSSSVRALLNGERCLVAVKPDISTPPLM
jgi:hypothetical protein